MTGKVTVLIPTSPILSHPSTDIIFETLASVRKHLPNCAIIVMADGIRMEQAEMWKRYSDYVLKLAGTFISELNISLKVFPNHLHQVGMLREVVPNIRTPYIFFCEHDTPLCDRPIDWKGILDTLDSGDLEFARFLPEETINEAHEYLMCGEMESHGAKFIKTIQYSARPQIASVEWYKRALSCFSPNANAFLEDGLYTHCVSAPWENWRMGIYAPADGMKRSYHLDGRAQEKKWDETQVF